MIVLAFAVLFTLVLLTNLVMWPPIRGSKRSEVSEESVAVLIPARNEEANIGACIESALQQGDSVSEILVYDDHSTDDTARIVQRFAKRDPRVRLIGSAPLPTGWCGKNYACWRLAQAASAPWLLFLDADARLERDAVQQLAREAKRRGLTFLSAWPALEQRSFWERLFMPLLNYSVLTLYPSVLSLCSRAACLGLAHGACLLIERDAYFRVDGHRSVRAEIFEDTRLARAWRSAGEKGLCLDGRHMVSVRMYESLPEIWNGFLKNVYPAFRREAMFWLFLLVHAGAFLAPFVLAVLALFTSLPFAPYAAAAGAVLVGRFALSIRFGYSIWPIALHPVAEVGLIILALTSRRRFRRAAGVVWKGRSYSVAAQRDAAG